MECQDVEIVDESLHRNLEWKRQEMLWFYGGGIVVIPTAKGRVMYVDNWELAKFQHNHRYETY